MKRTILLIAVTLALVSAQERSLLQRRKAFAGNIVDTGKIINDVNKQITDSFTGLAKTMNDALSGAFKDFTPSKDTIEALAKIGNTQLGDTIAQLKKFTSGAGSSIKTLMQDVGEQAFTLAQTVSSEMQQQCPALSQAQTNMKTQMEAFVKSLNPDEIKKNAKYIQDMTMDKVTDVATQLKAQAESMKGWDKSSFKVKFSLPSVADIESVGCMGACKAECDKIKASSKTVLSNMFQAAETGKKVLENTFSTEKDLGQEILNRFTKGADQAKAKMQLFCSTTEALGDHLSSMKDEAKKITDHYQSKICSSATAGYISDSTALMKCLFNNAQNVSGIANSNIRKVTKHLSNAIEGVSCQDKSGGRIKLRIKRRFPKVKLSLSSADLDLLKTDISALKVKLSTNIKSIFGGKAEEVSIDTIVATEGGRRQRQLSTANAEAKMDVTVSDDDALGVSVESSSYVVTAEEEEPQYSDGDLNTQSTVSGASSAAISVFAIMAFAAARFA